MIPTVQRAFDAPGYAPPTREAFGRKRRRITILALGTLLLVVAPVATYLVVADLVVAERSEPTAANAAPADGLPAGQKDGWELVFSDEFEGSALDTARWIDQSSAEADGGHGNHDNAQLEWNQVANCQVSAGELVMTAKREPFVAPSGTRYDWTSCLLSSTPSFAFQYGYIEERAILPSAMGFWPAFWTWQAPEVDKQVETDVYELYSADRREFQLTQHSGARGACEIRPRFDPAAGWHTYGAAIEPSGTTWYMDGAKVCHTAATSDGATNIISNLAVYAKNPPAASTRSAVKRVDYIRAWKRG